MEVGVIFNIDEAMTRSAFNVFLEPIKKMMVTKTEAFEKNSVIDKIFIKRKMTSFQDEFRSDLSMGEFSPAEDMEKAKLDSFREGYRKAFRTQIWKNSFIISLQTKEDGDLSTINATSLKFIQGYHRTREKFAYAILAGGLTGSATFEGKVFDCTGHDTTDGEIDGTTVSIFNNNHLPVGGVTDLAHAQSNKFVTSGLVTTPEEVLEVLGRLETNCARIEDDKGNIIGSNPNKIIVSSEFKFKNLLEVALKTKYTSEMGENGINTLYGRYEVIPVPYLHLATGFSDADKAIILLDSTLNQELMGAVWNDRSPLVIRSYIDDDTEANVWAGRARFSAGFNNWRPFTYVKCSGDADENHTPIELDDSILSTGVVATVDGVEVVGSDGYNLTVAAASTTTAVEFSLNQTVSLVGSPVAKVIIGGVAYTYGAIALKSGDATKIIVTPAGGNGVATEGTFYLYIPANSLKGTLTTKNNTKTMFKLTVTA